MFISKKKFEDALHEAKLEVAKEWERKLCETEARCWRDNDEYRKHEYNERHFSELEKRVLALEKETGLVKETHCCHCPNEVIPARF